jgi:hypothetical protein
MAQIRNQDVSQALGELDGLGTGGPTLRPEDVDRVKAIAAEPNTAVRARRMAALLQELERQFMANTELLAQLQRGFGLGADGPRALLDSDRLSEQARAQLYGSLDAFTQQIADEVRREARQAVAGPARPMRAVRPGRLRV